MSKAGLLPRRWRENPEGAAFAEAIAHVLDTAPVRGRLDGLAYVAALRTADVLPFLVAAKSLWSQLGRGRFVVVADRSVTGADRTILAHHLDDPEFAPAPTGALPAGLPWAAIETALERRRGEYWLVLSPSLVASGPVPELAAAMATNRTVAMDHAPGALMGLSAGGPGRFDPAQFVEALGADRSPGAQQGLVLQREADPVALPPSANLAHFPGALRFGDHCRATSRAAIAAFG